MNNATDFPTPAPRQAAFAIFLRAYKVVVDKMERDLTRFGVPLVEYQVLFRLARADENKMRFRDLANSLIVSQSRVSRLMDNMVEKGYVRREITAEDRRATFAVLTDEGRIAYEKTTPHFVDAFYEHFSDNLADEDLDSFVRILRGFVAEDISTTKRAVAREEPPEFARVR
jgi:MarR family 2-MHQ and catechol resistance regulon transcriptional repressor